MKLSVHFFMCCNMIEIERYLFKSPCTIAISGATGCGKTTFLTKLLKETELFSNPPDRVIYCYGAWQSIFNDMSGVEFRSGVDIPHTTTDEHTVIVLDDLMNDVFKSKNAEDLFTKGSHHKNISVIFLVQNLFQQGRHAKTIMLNTHYLILMKNARDTQQVKTLGRQSGMEKTVEQAYKDCMSKAYGYLVVDLSPHKTNDIVLRSGIFCSEQGIVYLPKT